MCQRKEEPLPEHREAGQRQLKAWCDNTFPTQAVTQSPQKMLGSSGKSMGSNKGIAGQTWRVLWQAKLHQQVLILSVEDDKEAGWFVVEGVIGSKRVGRK